MLQDNTDAQGLVADLSFTQTGSKSKTVGTLSLYDGQGCGMHGCMQADLYRSTDGGAQWK